MQWILWIVYKNNEQLRKKNAFLKKENVNQSGHAPKHIRTFQICIGSTIKYEIQKRPYQEQGINKNTELKKSMWVWNDLDHI